MNIVHLSFTQGAREATGLTVIIDVFRAFSTACYLYSRGARKVIAALSPDDAFDYRRKHKGALLAGERNEKKVDGFDFGNSPSEIIRQDLSGKTTVLTTSAGTLGLMNAVHATERITGSFVNAGAIVRYIRKRQPETVSLVSMGYNAKIPADEDRLCADYIESLLLDKTLSMDDMEPVIRSGTGSRFFDPSNRNSPVEDYHLCLDTNRFDFVLSAVEEGKYLYLKQLFI